MASRTAGAAVEELHAADRARAHGHAVAAQVTVERAVVRAKRNGLECRNRRAHLHDRDASAIAGDLRERFAEELDILGNSAEAPH